MSTAVANYVEPPTPRALQIIELEARKISKSLALHESLRGEENLPALIQVGLTAQALGVVNLAIATQHIHIIEGRPSISATLSVGVAEARVGMLWKQDASTDQQCIVRGFRPDWPERWGDAVIEWTIAQAEQAGLLERRWERGEWKQAQSGKRYFAVSDVWFEGSGDRPQWAREGVRDVKLNWRPNWHRYPADMLFARATKRLSKNLASAALVGLTSNPINLDHDLEDSHLPDRDAPIEVRGRILDDGDPNVIDVEPEPDERPLVSVPRERIIVQTETVEPPVLDPLAAMSADEWAHRWGGMCRQYKASLADSKQILGQVTDGAAEYAAQVHPSLRDECELALGQWVVDMATPADGEA